jgi:hypothetical protein
LLKRTEKELTMRRITVGLIPAIRLVLGSTAHAQSPAAFRVLFGVSDVSQTRWEGSLKITQAGQYSLEPWRFDEADNIDGEFFHFSNRPGQWFHVPPNGKLPVANGFIISASAVGDDSEFSSLTSQGNFSFRASEVAYGKGIYKLGGRVYVDRVLVTVRLTDTREEEDYPALATGANGDIWLAYVQFHHSPDADQIRQNLQHSPQDFKFYAEPTGGDQIWARKYSNGSWGENIPVTTAGRDCYKAAVAVDGSGRAWVIWSENREGNFDIFARAVDGTAAREQVQISKEAGADIDPVATTDCGWQSVDCLARLAQWGGGHLQCASGGQGILQACQGLEFEPGRMGPCHRRGQVGPR